MPAKLNIVVALACEARILLDAYQLSRIETAVSFPIYVNKDRSIHLIISGIGKVNAAAAVGYIHGFTSSETAICYLNIGIAGGIQQTMGDIFLAHKIIDLATGKVFYPTIFSRPHISSIEISSVDKLSDYPLNGLIDMEASGFFQAATSFITQEQLQVLKIVSDNSIESIEAIRPALVMELFSMRLPEIQQVIDYLLNLSTTESAQQLELIHFPDFNANWHFTNYQQHQLRELLRRWQVFYPQINPLVHCQNHKNSQAVLRALDQHLLNYLSC